MNAKTQQTPIAEAINQATNKQPATNVPADIVKLQTEVWNDAKAVNNADNRLFHNMLALLIRSCEAELVSVTTLRAYVMETNTKSVDHSLRLIHILVGMGEAVEVTLSTKKGTELVSMVSSKCKWTLSEDKTAIVYENAERDRSAFQNVKQTISRVASIALAILSYDCKWELTKSKRIKCSTLAFREPNDDYSESDLRDAKVLIGGKSDIYGEGITQSKAKLDANKRLDVPKLTGNPSDDIKEPPKNTMQLASQYLSTLVSKAQPDIIGNVEYMVYVAHYLQAYRAANTKQWDIACLNIAKAQALHEKQTGTKGIKLDFDKLTDDMIGDDTDDIEEQSQAS